MTADRHNQGASMSPVPGATPLIDVKPDRVTLRTTRLIVRTPRAGDGSVYAHYYRSQVDHLQPVSPKFDPSIFDDAAWEAAIPGLQQKWANRTEARFMLWYYERMLGVANLTRIVGDPCYTATLGYTLAEDAQGHGLMSEALVAIIKFAFDELNIHRIEAAYMPRNEKSGSVLRRLGFAVEGSARDYMLINGRWEDHILMAKINPNWRNPA